MSVAAAGVETITDYIVTGSDAQLVTFTSLSPNRYYTLTCYPITSALFASTVYATVWSDTLMITYPFGGVSKDSVEFRNLTPFRHASGSYDMQYEIRTDSAFTQRGYCSFR